MKKLALLALCSAFCLISLGGCWHARYDTANDSDYYYYPSSPNLDYINSLSPETTPPVVPAPK